MTVYVVTFTEGQGRIDESPTADHKPGKVTVLGVRSSWDEAAGVAFLSAGHAPTGRTWVWGDSIRVTEYAVDDDTSPVMVWEAEKKGTMGRFRVYTPLPTPMPTPAAEPAPPPAEERPWPMGRPFAEVSDALKAAGMAACGRYGFKLTAVGVGVDVYYNVGVDDAGKVRSASAMVGNAKAVGPVLLAVLHHVTAAAGENVRREIRKILDVPATEDLDRRAGANHTHDIR